MGWAIGETLGATLVLQALAMARLHRDPPANLLFQWDRGAQNAAGDFRAALDHAHLVPSMMSRWGKCHENATMESLWSLLKLELVYRPQFATHDQARAAIFDHIEAFYDRERLHSALNFLSTTASEFQNLNPISRFYCPFFETSPYLFECA